MNKARTGLMGPKSAILASYATLGFTPRSLPSNSPNAVGYRATTKARTPQPLTALADRAKESWRVPLSPGAEKCQTTGATMGSTSNILNNRPITSGALLIDSELLLLARIR